MSRYMRVIVMFDLPTTTAEERKEYMCFRKYLIRKGYDMLQYSVYSRIVKHRDEADSCLFGLQLNLPSSGNVRVLTVTEKQYAQMKIILGKPTVTEEKVCAKELIIL